MPVIDMSKNQKINMVKDDGSTIKRIFIGLKWDRNRFSQEGNYDLDIVGFLTNKERKAEYPEDLVNHQNHDYNKVSWDWCELSKDNLDGSDEKGITFDNIHFDEYMIVDADKLPEGKEEFYICLTIYRAVERLQNLGMIDNAEMRIYDYDNPEEFCRRYDLSEDENFSRLNAAEVGKLYRYGNGFKFQALGRGYLGGTAELFKTFGFDIDEGRDGN